VYIYNHMGGGRRTGHEQDDDYDFFFCPPTLTSLHYYYNNIGLPLARNISDSGESNNNDCIALVCVYLCLCAVYIVKFMYMYIHVYGKLLVHTHNGKMSHLRRSRLPHDPPSLLRSRRNRFRSPMFPPSPFHPPTNIVVRLSFS